MQLTQAAISLIKEFEGCKLNAYQDIVGKWTIGFGHTGKDVVKGLVWSQQQADENLTETLTIVGNAIRPHLSGGLNDNQFSACICLAYNIGVTAFCGSTLASMIKYTSDAASTKQASNEFPKWDRAAGSEVPGLLRRRMAEQKLFLTLPSTVDGVESN